MLEGMRRGCLVLDFDGTILDTEEPVYVSWAEVWDAHGELLVREEWQKIIGTNGYDPAIELEQRVGRPLDPELHDRRRARRDELQARHLPRAGVVSWLAQAEALGVSVGIASSSPVSWVESHLERLGLRDSFSCLSCCDDTIPAKPDPTSYRLACARLGAQPIHSVAVEDSPHGVAASVGAGLFTIAFPHGLTADLDFSAADLVVDSLDEIELADALTRASQRAST